MTHDTPQSKEAFDVILTTHNHLELTINSINALYQFTPVPFRVFIVDDSTDLTPEWVKTFSLNHNNVTYIRPDYPIKTGNQSFMIGLQYTTSEIVVTLVNSATVEPEWYIIPLQIIKQQPDIGLVAIKLLYPNGSIWHAGIGFNNSLPYHIGVGAPGHHYTHIRPIEAANPSVGFFRRKALEKALDCDTYIGWRGFEDTDICLMLRQNGWKIMYCGYSSAYHIESPTRLHSHPNPPQFWAEYNENMRRFLAKWHGNK